MSTHADAAPAGGFLARHHFLLRRLHSLSGIVPIGVFVCFHLFTNMQMAFGTFQHEVDWIHSQPAVIFAEVFGIWLPIVFHAILGIVYTFTGKSNVGVYGYSDNWRYTFQRITGVIALIFIFFHIATLRWRWDMGFWYTPFFDHGIGFNPNAGANQPGLLVPFAYESTAIALQFNFAVFLFYVVGVLAVIYHWSNGLWTAAISWGWTLSAQSQRRWGYVCGAMFVALFACSALALWGAMTYKITDADLATMERTKALYEQTGEKPHKGHAYPYTVVTDEAGMVVGYEFEGHSVQLPDL